MCSPEGRGVLGTEGEGEPEQVGQRAAGSVQTVWAPRAVRRTFTSVPSEMGATEASEQRTD